MSLAVHYENFLFFLLNHNHSVITGCQRHLYHPGRLHPALQLQTHRDRGDPLVQAADPCSQLLLQQGPVRTPEQALQREDVLVQLAHSSRQCIPAPQEGQSAGQGPVQVLHQHAKRQSGNVRQPGGERSARITNLCFLCRFLLCEKIF